MKLEALRGLSTPECMEPAIEMLTAEQKKYAYPKPEGGQRLCPDKTGYRIGIAPPEEVSKRMIDESIAAKAKIHARNVEQKKMLSIADLAETVEILRGMCMIAYPAYHGLYDWDLARQILEDQVDYPGWFPDCEVFFYWGRKFIGNSGTIQKRLPSGLVGKNGSLGKV